MKSLRNLVLGVSACAMLAACSVAPGYQRPETAAPAAWQNGATSTAWPAPDWWRSFGSDELDRLVAAAAQGSFDLQAAASRVAQAQAQAKIAGAPLYPTLSAAGDASRGRGAGGRSADRTVVRRASDLYQGSLSASYEIDFWGKNRAAAKSAGELAKASVYDRETAALTLVSDVATTYFQILSLDERLRIAQANLADARQVLSLIETQANMGKLSDLELAQQRQAVAAVEATIPALQQQRAQAVDALAILLGRRPEGAYVGGESLATLTLPAIAPGLPSDLLRRRPDIQAAEAQLRAANADIGVARAELLPSVNLTGEGGIASGAMTALLQPGSTFYNLAASLVAPIFSGGRLSGQVELAEARYQELTANYHQAVLSAFRDVEDALAANADLAEVERAQQEQVTQAQTAYRLADLRYRSGATDFLTVLDAQRTLFQAQDALAQTKLARLDAAVSLYKALGGGWGTGSSA